MSRDLLVYFIDGSSFNFSISVETLVGFERWMSNKESSSLGFKLKDTYGRTFYLFSSTIKWAELLPIE